MDTLVSSFSDFHEAVEAFGRRIVVYRGQKSTDWELKPKISRLPLRSSAQGKEEKMIIRLFQEQAIPLLKSNPETMWEWLAIGQHHGLPTRLLDWSRNPLVAAYFAVEEEHDGDSVVFAYKNNSYVSFKKYPDPFDVAQVKRYIPRHVTQRITVQSGLFTIHPYPTDDFKESEGVSRIIIKSEFRKKIKGILL